MSVLVAVLLPSLLLVLALVVDGTDRLRLQDRADAVAAEAARAGATNIDTRGAIVTLDRAAALQAARSALAATGHTGATTIDPAGAAVHVSVAHREPAPIGLLGRTLTATGHATAGLGTGTTTAGGLP